MEKSHTVTPPSTYWFNKPVMNKTSSSSHRIEDLSKRQAYISNDPIKLPSIFKWAEVDIKNQHQMINVAKFLQEYYITDKKNKFMLHYTGDYLSWVINDNGFMLNIVTNTGTICGTVAVILRNMRIFDRIKKCAEVNFLCAHPKYRGKKMVNVLIDEAIRRCYNMGIQVGIFTTERVVPTPTTTIRFYHRPINYAKLYKTGFIDSGDPKEVGAHYDVIGDTKYVPITSEYYDELYNIYLKSMETYNIYDMYTKETFLHYFTNNKYSRTYITLEDDHIKDYISYYMLPYTTANNTYINACYLMSYSRNADSAEIVMLNIIRLAKRDNMDVLNVTDNMQNRSALLVDDLDDSDKQTENERAYGLNFVRGTGKLNLNFFNWACPKVKPNQVCWTTF